MKSKVQVFGTFLLGMLVLCGCGDDDERKPFGVEQTAYEVPMKSTASIDVVNGSGRVDVKVDNEQVATAAYYETDEAHIVFGRVLITPKAKGETQVTLTDHATNERQVLTVKVVDSYVGLTMTAGPHPTLVPQDGQRYVAYLVDNAQRECLFFAMDNGKVGRLADRGSYRFELKPASGAIDTYAPYLTLTYHATDDGVLAINGKAHTEVFDMTRTLGSPYGGAQVVGLLNEYLGLGWSGYTLDAAKRGAPATRTSPASYYPYRMDKVTEGTELPRVLIGELRLSWQLPMPMGVLE